MGGNDGGDVGSLALQNAECLVAPTLHGEAGVLLLRL